MTIDLNNDNKSDVLDISYLLSKWKTADTKADLNTDGIVDSLDLSILLSSWSYSPPQPNVWVTNISRQGIADAIASQPQGAVIGLENGIYDLTSQTTTGATLVPKSGQSFIARNPRQAILDGGGVAKYAMWNGSASNVKFYGLKMQNFVNQAESGGGLMKFGAPTIGDAAIWDNCEFDNIGWRCLRTSGSGTGTTGPTHLRRNYFHHSGEVGSGYQGVGSEITDNEIAYMNQAGGRDAVTKWVGNRDLYVARNHSHHNNGNGLWFDFENTGIIEHNLLENNTVGIHWELSLAAEIRNNVLRNNGRAIKVISCSDTKVYNNEIYEVTDRVFEVYDQIRQNTAPGAPRLLRCSITNNYVEVTRATSSPSGWIAQAATYDQLANGPISPYNWTSCNSDPSDPCMRDRCLWDNNEYRVANMGGNIDSAWLFQYEHATKTASEWRAYGQDVNSKFVLV